MTLWIVWRTGMYHGCWECEGGGDAELWQVYAETANQALNLVRDALQLSPWDSPAELHCLAVSPSRARKARIIPQSQWFADQSAFVDPPPPNFGGHQ